jgi:hypothetical protein
MAHVLVCLSRRPTDLKNLFAFDVLRRMSSKAVLPPQLA